MIEMRVCGTIKLYLARGVGGKGKGEGGGWAAEFLLYFYFFICFLSLTFMLYRETKYHYRPSGDVDTVACV